MSARSRANKLSSLAEDLKTTECTTILTVLKAAKSPDALRRLLAFDPVQHPLAVQLGGRDPERMGEAARPAADIDQVKAALRTELFDEFEEAHRFASINDAVVITERDVHQLKCLNEEQVPT